jgi:hypothetical protein
MIKKISTVTILVSVLSVLAAAPVGAEASKEDTEKCKQMIRDMVGVDPSPKVVKLCKAGKPKEAMKAAMAGE